MFVMYCLLGTLSSCVSLAHPCVIRIRSIRFELSPLIPLLYGYRFTRVARRRDVYRTTLPPRRTLYGAVSRIDALHTAAHHTGRGSAGFATAPHYRLRTRREHVKRPQLAPGPSGHATTAWPQHGTRPPRLACLAICKGVAAYKAGQPTTAATPLPHQCRHAPSSPLPPRPFLATPLPHHW